MPANCHLRQSDLASFAKRIANNNVAFARQSISWRDEIRPLEIAAIDILSIDELY